MKDIGTRIKQVREDAGLSKSDLAKIVGVSPSAVTQWENGTTKTYDAGNLVGVARATGTTVEWLVLDGDARQVMPVKDQGDFEPPEGYVRLRVLDALPQMGHGGEPIDKPEVLRYVDVLGDYVSLELRTNPEKIDLLPAKGDSMSGTIEDGDIVFVDRTIRHYDGDGIYVIVWSNRLLLKRLHAMMDGRLEIKSDNNRYTPEFVASNEADSLAICGRVVGKWGLQRL
ncbi:XRE family transcriptional regulator [Robbsia andropogonis]|uniref:XRE family transcriptional regulator n=1 Tax=Robbsia andropogonis TaxID=28092 RepID=UPI003D20FD4C